LLLVHSENVEHDVARNQYDITSVADQRALVAIDRNLTGPSGYNSTKPFTSHQRCRLKRQRLQPGPAGARRNGDSKGGDQRDD